LRQGASAEQFKRCVERISSNALKWCGTLFPTYANAQETGMSLSYYEDFVFSAGMLDAVDPMAAWQAHHVKQQPVPVLPCQPRATPIVAPGTDLRYDTGGRPWINCSGEKHFPDGEIFTCPLEDSVNGVVRFTYPAVFSGNEVEDVRLEFKDGQVVNASAARGEAFLHAMLDTDEGARRLGEAAFGLNYGIQKYTKNTL